MQDTQYGSSMTYKLLQSCISEKETKGKQKNIKRKRNRKKIKIELNTAYRSHIHMYVETHIELTYIGIQRRIPCARSNLRGKVPLRAGTFATSERCRNA